MQQIRADQAVIDSPVLVEVRVDQPEHYKDEWVRVSFGEEHFAVKKSLLNGPLIERGDYPAIQFLPATIESVVNRNDVVVKVEGRLYDCWSGYLWVE